MLLATQFGVRGARCGTDLDMSRRNKSTNKSNNHSQGLDYHVETTEFDAIGHHVKKSKRGACQQKAATVLPNRTAAAIYIFSSLSSFEFDIVRYGGTS